MSVTTIVGEVDQCLEQAEVEGWVVTRGTAATIAVTLGVLVTRFETMDQGSMLDHVRHCLQQALDLVS